MLNDASSVSSPFEVYALSFPSTTTSVRSFCMNKALALNKLPPITLEQTKKFIGNGAALYAERAAGNRKDLSAKVLEDYNRIYDSCKSENTTLYPGVGEMLKKLKAQGVKIAIVSNKPQSSTDEVYKNLLQE